MAQAAGVSLSTASRALSRPDMVSPDVREAIEQVCRELRYIPSHAARTLSMNRTGVVGVIVPTIANPLFAPTVDGLRSAFDEAGRALLMNSCDRDPRREYEQCRAFIERGVEAVVLMNAVHDPRLFEMLASYAVPYVCVGGPLDDEHAPAVTFDNGRAMVLAVEYVLEHGHRDVAILTGPRSTSPVIGERIDGAQRALATAGFAPPPEWIVECGFDGPVARQGARLLLAKDDRPTAIVCTGDMHALAAVVECRSRGISVPGDISITGCNDMPVAGFADPPLTTVRTPYRELGTRAAEEVMRLLGTESVPARTLCDVELVVRASVAAPPIMNGPARQRRRTGSAPQFKDHEF